MESSFPYSIHDDPDYNIHPLVIHSNDEGDRY